MWDARFAQDCIATYSTYSVQRFNTALNIDFGNKNTSYVLRDRTVHGALNWCFSTGWICDLELIISSPTAKG